MKPTKTKLEINKLEKQIAKLTGDLAAKRRLEALRAEADALQKAIKAEPCDKPHFPSYPSPCPLSHSPWYTGPVWAHHSFCRCNQCHPSHGWLTNPIITVTNAATKAITTTTANTGDSVTIYGGLGSNNGTQMGADGVPFTFTTAIGQSDS